MPETTVSENVVFKFPLNLNPGKAAGPGVTPRCRLQVVAMEIAPALTPLFNSSIATGQVLQQ